MNLSEILCWKNLASWICESVIEIVSSPAIASFIAFSKVALSCCESRAETYKKIYSNAAILPKVGQKAHFYLIILGTSTKPT